MKIRGARVRLFFALIIVAAFITACNALLDFESYKVATPDGGPNNTTDGSTSDVTNEASSQDGGCIDPTGFGGRGCFRCTPTTNDELLNACTTGVTYEPFDNKTRINGFDPANPRPPLVDGGPTPPPFDAGATTPTDAGPPPTAPLCSTIGGGGALSLPNPVMVLGATGFPMDVIAKSMGTAATIFYSENGSCAGVASMILNSPKVQGEVTFYDVNGVATKCTLDEPHPADLTLSALFADSCAEQNGLPANVQLPAGVEDLLGPVNPVMFAAPATSQERVISAEAAYKVYGFGVNSGVAPWVDENYIFRRTASSGNQQSTARTLGLPIGGLRGRDSSGSSNMKKALQASDAPNKTIGISSSEIIDINRDVMKSLAYQHYNQVVGFYPDSDPGAFDRRNVRNGHYYMWIPLHVLVRTNAGDPIAAQNLTLDPDGSKKAARDAAVKLLAFVMVNRQEPPVKSVDVFAALKKVGNIPQCAMTVTRTKEGAPLQPYQPSARCGCAYEKTSPGTTPPECKACTDSTSCPANRPTCSFGFCE